MCKELRNVPEQLLVKVWGPLRVCHCSVFTTLCTPRSKCNSVDDVPGYIPDWMMPNRVVYTVVVHKDTHTHTHWVISLLGLVSKGLNFKSLEGSPPNSGFLRGNKTLR